MVISNITPFPADWKISFPTKTQTSHLRILRQVDVLVCSQRQERHEHREHHGHGVSRASDLLDLSTGNNGFKEWLVGRQWMPMEFNGTYVESSFHKEIIQLLHIISYPCLIFLRFFQHLLFPQAMGFCCSSSMCFVMPCLVHRVFATGLQPSASQLFDNHQRYVCG